jgi:AraC family transcriptional regulator
VTNPYFLIAELNLPPLRFELFKHEWPPHFEATFKSASAVLAYTKVRADRLLGHSVCFDTGSSRSQRMRVGEITLRPPGIPLHVFGEHDALSGTSLYCTLEPEYFVTRSRLSDWDGDRLRCCLNIRSEPIMSIMKRVTSELLQPDFASQDIVEGLGQTLVFELARVFGSPPSSCNGRARLSPWQLRCIDDALHESGRNWPARAEIAAACGLSPRYLAHAFLQTTGRTLSEHMQAVRLETAKKLITASNLTIKQVAIELGFPSLCSFSLAFKRAVGVSPRRFGRMAGTRTAEEILRN